MDQYEKGYINPDTALTKVITSIYGCAMRGCEFVRQMYYQNKNIAGENFEPLTLAEVNIKSE